METAYLVVTYSTWHEDDIGPVLVATQNYIDFSDVLTGERVPMLGYLALERLPIGVSLEEAQRTASLYGMVREVGA